MNNKIAILGRGKSLRKFSKYSHLFDIIYMVGTFHKEVNKIGLKHFENKKIIHFVGRSDWGWRKGIDKKLNIVKVQTMYYPHQLKAKKRKKGILERFKNFKIHFLPECMKKRGFPVLDREILEKYSRKYNNYKDLCCFLEEKFKDKIKKNIKSNHRNRYWPTTGIFAIDMCLVNNNDIEEIYLFGIDACYNVSYCRYKWEDSKYNWEKQKKGRPFTIKEKVIIYHVKELVKEYSRVKFYSASKVIKMDNSNWNII